MAGLCRLYGYGVHGVQCSLAAQSHSYTVMQPPHHTPPPPTQNTSVDVLPEPDTDNFHKAISLVTKLNANTLPTLVLL
jgi:hypothetical protein